MVGLLSLFLALLTAPFKSKSRLEAENTALRHQLIILRCKMKSRVRLTTLAATAPISLLTTKIACYPVKATQMEETICRADFRLA